MEVPLWRVTRTPTARRVYEWLAARGVKITRLGIFRRPAGAASGEMDGAVRADGTPNTTVAVRQPGDDPDPQIAALLPDRTRAHLHPADHLAVARRDGTPVGVAVASRDRIVTVPPLDARIVVDGTYCWGVYVAPAHRNRGVATRLVNDLLAATPGPWIALVAPDNAPSRRLFTNRGFERHGAVTHVRIGPLARRWETDPMGTIERSIPLPT